jgi:hypothetical protein
MQSFGSVMDAGSSLLAISIVLYLPPHIAYQDCRRQT